MQALKFVQALAGAWLLGSALAHAGTITSIGTASLPGSSTGSIGPLGVAPAPNNDNASGASPNTVPYNIFHNTLGTLEVEFVTSESGGSTEYRFTQTFINNTGQVWTGFEFLLGYGVGAAFTPSGADDGLDFDTPDADPAPTASLFTVLQHDSDRIVWSGGSVPSIGVLTLSFALDVPDDLAGFNPDQLSRFTLRQVPIVAAQEAPEPSSLWLLGAGVLGLAAWRRRA